MEAHSPGLMLLKIGQVYIEGFNDIVMRRSGISRQRWDGYRMSKVISRFDGESSDFLMNSTRDIDHPFKSSACSG
jgi:hypothetical protein